MKIRSILLSLFGGSKFAIKPHELETHEQLLDRAAMDQYYLNTGVFYSMDGARIQVNSGYDDDFADCIGFGWNLEGTKTWYPMHMSPARARLFANEILRRCELKEAEEGDPGMNRIDAWAGATPDPRLAEESA